MPYKKSYNNNKNGSHKSSYGACGRMVLSDASKALRIAESVRRLINVEYKFIDTISLQAISTTPLIIPLSNISQGDTTITRDGSQIKCLSIQFSYFWTLNASAAVTTMRVLLVKDKQTNQSLYAAGDLLSDITASDAINSPYNRDNRKRFNIMYDKIISLSDSNHKQMHFGMKFSQEQILRYDANAGTIADLTQSSYSIMLVSTEPTNTPVFTSFVRLNFVDN